jgi:hypothetical protein
MASLIASLTRDGETRVRAKIGLQNTAYSIRRLVTLERIAAAEGGVGPKCQEAGVTLINPEPPLVRNHIRNSYQFALVPQSRSKPALFEVPIT